MRFSNCILFALHRWCTRGGYLVLRPSKYGWWIHVLWSADLRIFEEYVPIEKKSTRRFPPILFRGRVKMFRVRRSHV